MERERQTDEGRGRSRGHLLLSLPNLLSLSRVPLGGLFWLTLDGAREMMLSFAVLCVAALTDVLDGYVARRRGSDGPTGVGSWLDPICDKIFVAFVLLAIYFERRPPLWLLALIMSRELIQLPMSVVYRFSPALQHWVRYDFRASALGKAATVMQFLAVGALLLDSPAVTTLAWVTLAVGLAAIADYLRRAIVLARSRR